MPVTVRAQPVGRGQHQHGDREREQDANHPGELGAVGVAIDIGEPFERIHGGDGDDGAQKLLLESGETDTDKALRPQLRCSA